MSISLVFTPALRVGGEVISGEVELHFPQVHEDEIEEVHVKLRGQVYAKVARQYGNQYFDRRERIQIVKENISLWTKGSAYPPADSQILRLPFQFQLPYDVQPSCEFTGLYKYARVGYSVEAVGVRQGVLHLNRRIERPFSVVAPDSAGSPTRNALSVGWLGDWNTIERSDKIRRGLWGGYADVRMELKLPSVNTFPIFTQIPFELTVTSITKEMKYDEEDETSTERLFPSPPIHPKEVEFVLRRHVHLNAQGWKATDTDTVAAVGGMGKDTENQKLVNVQVTNKQWLPSENEKHTGSWKQMTTMKSFIMFKSTPSFETPIFSMHHILRIKVDFPGIGNNLEAEIPISIKSGMNTPDPDGFAPPYPGPPPQLDLPPAYWSGAQWGDQDEKDKSLFDKDGS